MMPMETQMKTLIAALALGILLAAPAFVQSRGSGLSPNAWPCRIANSHDGYEGKKGGGVQWHYQACMADQGQPFL
jgi:hypothetical protein